MTAGDGEDKSRPTRLITGRVVSFTDNPRRLGATQVVRDHVKGGVAIGKDGRIHWCGALAHMPRAFNDLPWDDHGASLILPGFIDTHIHFPQYRMLAAPGSDLLDWLNRFTFPEEARYADGGHAEKAAEIFLDRLLAHGTTAALVFSSSHAVACEALFAAAEARNMALVTGKTLMDRNAPAAVRDTAAQGAEDSAQLAETWHGRGRLAYAITPRFVVTSTEDQLAATRELHRAFPDCLLHSHLSESVGELALVKKTFPWARDYTHVYEHYGLLGPRSLFAHGIHLNERECQVLHDSGSSIIHCPTSNTFLGSGLFNIGHLEEMRRPVALGLATDVGGGTDFSMLRTMGEAHKVAKLNGHWLSGHDAFYMATLGNARRLHLHDHIGSLEAGKFADLVVLDPAATPVLASRHQLSESLEDILFALMILGDDRAVRATYVKGKKTR